MARPAEAGVKHASKGGPLCRTMICVDAEQRHRCCWYGRSTTHVPDDPGFHSIVDGQLVYCAHPMYWPVVRYEFDLRNCEDCDVFRPRRSDGDKPLNLPRRTS